MKKITKWRPDTCQCEIEFEWDDDVKVKDRVHKVVSIKRCSFHQNQNNNDCFNEVLDENKRKNKVYDEIINNTIDSIEQIQKDGQKEKKLKQGKEYKWHFDKDRNLVVDLNKFSDKDSIKSAIKSKFGSKVIIN